MGYTAMSAASVDIILIEIIHTAMLVKLKKKLLQKICFFKIIPRVTVHARD